MLGVDAQRPPSVSTRICVSGWPRNGERSGADCKFKDGSASAAIAPLGRSKKKAASNTQSKGICPSRMPAVLHQTPRESPTSRWNEAQVQFSFGAGPETRRPRPGLEFTPGDE